MRILEYASLSKPSPKDKDIKSKILEIIRSKPDGADYKTLVSESGFTEAEVDRVVQELLEEGTCFEPTPGVIKVV
ncbi:MAG: hypothetical protein GXO63_03270 [Candidatus Micrarchaeota archaeon]|nr:hypothetical protein [Candidatus Micrarchaeota archaeon]